MSFVRFISTRNALFSLGLLAIAVITMTCIGWHNSPAQAVKAFDETLLAGEPLQMGDIRAEIGQAIVAVERDEWPLALRLIRDARNQWEAFVPLMQGPYEVYAWAKNDISLVAILWQQAISETEFTNMSSTKRALQSIEGIINKYRRNQTALAS